MAYWVKINTDASNRVKRLSGVQLAVFFELIRRWPGGNYQVEVNSAISRDIASHLFISIKSVTNSISKLSKSKVIIRQKRGWYKLDGNLVQLIPGNHDDEPEPTPEQLRKELDEYFEKRRSGYKDLI